jgi:hypothetical protein
VRSHAKASSAGSNQRHAGGLGAIFRGALATRGGSSRAKGSNPPRGLAAVPGLGAIFLLLLAFGPGSALAAPAITTTTVSAVTTKAAVLEADVDPEGEATTFHFEYGPADCAANPCASVPIPDWNVGSGSAPVRVKQEIEGLAPGTTYHLRAVATSGSGSTAGPDRTFTTYEPPVLETTCPNQAFRVGPGALLPNCRAYEMVSPIDKNGGDIKAQPNGSGVRNEVNQASIAGDKLTYSSAQAFGDAAGSYYSNQYLATRTQDGWFTHGISPPRTSSIFGETQVFPGLENPFDVFTPDLSHAVLFDDAEPTLTPDAVPGSINAYLRDNASATYEAISREKATAWPLSNGAQEWRLLGAAWPGEARFEGISDDANVAVLTTAAAISPEATTGLFHVYGYENGILELYSVMPDGSENPTNAIVGSRAQEGAVSADGSVVYWTLRSGEGGPITFSAGRIFARVDGEITVPVSDSVPGGAAATWLDASEDGSTAFFKTGDLEPSNLYEFDLATETNTLIAGQVLETYGASSDASYLYFVSLEDLASGAAAGQRNLYFHHEGTFTHIATLPAEDVPYTEQGGRRLYEGDSRVTPDGSVLAFSSYGAHTGYDNTDAASGEPDLELFVYQRDFDRLVCASCSPSGARPVGRPLSRPYSREGEGPVVKVDGKFEWAAAWIPPADESSSYALPRAPRILSDDGNQLYFNAHDALLPQDTNGQQDVYQWEAQGSGTCEKPGGCLSLLSTGQSPVDSEFVDASPDGRDVFIRTKTSLLPQDPGLRDIYNARSGGGFPIPPEPPAPCVGDSCQGTAVPPTDPTPASASFRGEGDPAPKARRRCPRVNKRAPQRLREAQRRKAKQCRRARRRAAR